MKKILFYITGHGFGHAAPMTEVINQLIAKDPQLVPVINTGSPGWFFKRRIAADFEYISCENDIGAVQKDWRRVDKFETLRQYSEFIEKETVFMRQQVDFVKQNNVCAVISDIPAAAFVVAKKSGVPGIGITNFSWDWIYEPYLEEYPQYRFVVEHIRQCYSFADRLLRLPFHGDMSAFPVVEDIPLIAMRSTAERVQVLNDLNIDADRKIVLLYFGSFDYGKVLSDEMLKHRDYCFICPETDGVCELPFIDLIKAADVVVTKPGYSIVSECVANQTPIMYTAREDFSEYDVLVNGIRKYAHNCFIPERDMFGGKWAEYIDQLLAAEFSWPEIAINGAETAAAKILESI